MWTDLLQFAMMQDPPAVEEAQFPDGCVVHGLLSDLCATTERERDGGDELTERTLDDANKLKLRSRLEGLLKIHTFLQERQSYENCVDTFKGEVTLPFIYAVSVPKYGDEEGTSCALEEYPMRVTVDGEERHTTKGFKTADVEDADGVVVHRSLVNAREGDEDAAVAGGIAQESAQGWVADWGAQLAEEERKQQRLVDEGKIASSKLFSALTKAVEGTKSTVEVRTKRDSFGVQCFRGKRGEVDVVWSYHQVKAGVCAPSVRPNTRATSQRLDYLEGSAKLDASSEAKLHLQSVAQRKPVRLGTCPEAPCKVPQPALDRVIDGARAVTQKDVAGIAAYISHLQDRLASMLAEAGKDTTFVPYSELE